MKTINISVLHTTDGYTVGVHIDGMGGNPLYQSYWGYDLEYDDCVVTEFSVPLHVIYTLSQYGYCFMWHILEQHINLPHPSKLPDFEVILLSDGYEAMKLICDYGTIINKNCQMW